MRGLVYIANRTPLLFLLVLSSWVLGASIFGLLEHASVIDCFYWSMTTMSTVGYGDISAATTAGKAFTILFQAYSIFILVPMAVSNLLSKVNTSAYTHDEQEWMESSIKRIAAKVGTELDEAPLDHEAIQ